jgi:hypothetical protein
VPNHQTDHDQCRILSGKCRCLRSLPCVMACHTKIWWSRSFHHAQNTDGSYTTNQNSFVL